MADVAPPDLWLTIKGLLGPIGTSLLGLIWRRADEVRQGKRLTWRAIVLDLPSVVGIGIAAGAVVAWIGLPQEVALGLACVASHLGTDVIREKALPLVLHRLGLAGGERSSDDGR